MFRIFKDIDDFDELVFENRNKEYGAYQLRKKYKSAVITGVIVSSLFATLVVVLPFALSFDSNEAALGGLSYYSVQMEGLELPPIDEIFIPPPPPRRTVELVQETVKYVPPVIVDTISPEENKFATMDEVLSETIIEDLDFNGIIGGDEFSSGVFGGIGDGDGTFFIVEVMPSFRGGDLNTFREWVQRRIIYPKAAIDAKIQGRVSLTFIVEPDGSVSNVTIIQGIGEMIDDQVVNVIRSSPKWNPGLQRGQPVRVRYSFPLNFIL